MGQDRYEQLLHQCSRSRSAFIGGQRAELSKLAVAGGGLQQEQQEDAGAD